MLLSVLIILSSTRNIRNNDDDVLYTVIMFKVREEIMYKLKTI